MNLSPSFRMPACRPLALALLLVLILVAGTVSLLRL